MRADSGFFETRRIVDLIVDPGREQLAPRDPEHFTTVIE